MDYKQNALAGKASHRLMQYQAIHVAPRSVDCMENGQPSSWLASRSRSQQLCLAPAHGKLQVVKESQSNRLAPRS